MSRIFPQLLILLAVIISPTLAWTLTDVGVFLIIKKNVQLQRGTQTINATVGMKVSEGDVVSTGVDSRAKIVMNDRNIINVLPSTKIRITKYSTGTERNVNLMLENGKLRTNVIQKYDGVQNKFEIRTLTAVAGVRGTRFITGYNNQTKITEVITLKGIVTVTQLFSNGRPPEYRVNRGEKIEVGEGSATSQPIKLPDADLKNFEQETDVKKDKTDVKENADSPALETLPNIDEVTMSNPPSGLQDARSKSLIERKLEKTKLLIIAKPPN